MRLSEAILLGDSLKKCEPKRWLTNDGSCGCAIGGALLASGLMDAIKAEHASNGHITQEPFEYECVKAAWPWLTAEHVKQISSMYYSVADGKLAIEQIADYVRTIEPPEPESAPALELEGFHLLRLIPGEPDHRCHDCINELDDSLVCRICGAKYQEVSS